MHAALRTRRALGQLARSMTQENRKTMQYGNAIAHN